MAFWKQNFNELFHFGKPVFPAIFNPGRYLAENLTLEDSVEYLYSTINKGNLISEEEGVELVTIQPNPSRTGLEKLHGLIFNDSLEFVVEYESVYGERWKVSSKRSQPIKLRK